MLGNPQENHVGPLGLRRLGGNIASTLLRQVLAIIIGLGFAIFLARSLGPEGNGLYALAILLPTLLSTFANLGVGPANVYFLGRGEYSTGEVVRGSLLLSGTLSGLGIVMTIPLLAGWGESLFPDVGRGLLLTGLVIFPFMLAQSLLLNVFQGRQEFGRYNRLGLVAPMVTLLAAFVLVGLLGLGVFSAVISFGVGQLAGLSLALLWLREEIFDGSGRSGYARDCLRYGWKSHLSNILAFLNYRVDIFLVNGFLNPVAVGIYVVAVQIAERLWILSQAVSTVLLPRLAELNDDESVRAELTPLIGRWVFFATVLVTVTVAVFSQPLVTLLFGEAYGGAVGALLWLLPGVTFFSMARVLSNDLAARGRPELNLYAVGVTVLANVVLNLLLIPRMGIEGAALATTSSYVAYTVLNLYIYRSLSNNPWFAPLVPSRVDLAYAKMALKHALRLPPRR